MPPQPRTEAWTNRPLCRIVASLSNSGMLRIFFEAVFRGKSAGARSGQREAGEPRTSAASPGRESGDASFVAHAGAWLIVALGALTAGATFH